MLVKLKDICRVVSGATPSTNISSYYDGDVYWITPKDLADNGNRKYIDDSSRKITESGYNSCSTVMIPKNNILISTRAPIGYMAINTIDCCTNQGFKSLICDTNKVNVDYLYYLLKSRMNEIELLGSGTTFKEVSKTSIENFEIDLPSLETQEKVASILSSIDTQIERNNAMVKRLQVLAHAIYKRWFIQFDYPNANKNLIYNDELKREIPDDWNVVNLSELIRKINLVTNDTINTPTIDLSVMPSSNISLTELNNSENFSTNLNKMIEGNILFGSIRPYLKKCGIAPCNGKVAGTVYQFEELQKNTYNYSLITMAQDSFFDYALKVSKGTRMPVVSAEDILAYKLPYNQQIVSLYNKLPIKTMVVAINKTTMQLKKLKEKLLPLLINGQLQ